MYLILFNFILSGFLALNFATASSEEIALPPEKASESLSKIRPLSSMVEDSEDSTGLQNPSIPLAIKPCCVVWKIPGCPSGEREDPSATPATVLYWEYGQSDGLPVVRPFLPSLPLVLAKRQIKEPINLLPSRDSAFTSFGASKGIKRTIPEQEEVQQKRATYHQPAEIIYSAPNMIRWLRLHFQDKKPTTQDAIIYLIFIGKIPSSFAGEWRHNKEVFNFKENLRKAIKRHWKEKKNKR